MSNPSKLHHDQKVQFWQKHTTIKQEIHSKINSIQSQGHQFIDNFIKDVKDDRKESNYYVRHDELIEKLEKIREQMVLGMEREREKLLKGIFEDNHQQQPIKKSTKTQKTEEKKKKCRLCLSSTKHKSSSTKAQQTPQMKINQKYARRFQILIPIRECEQESQKFHNNVPTIPVPSKKSKTNCCQP